MCLARSTPHTGSSGAQGLWSEFTAKPQLAAPKGSTGPTSVVTLHKLFVPAARNQRRHLGPQKSTYLPVPPPFSSIFLLRSCRKEYG